MTSLQRINQLKQEKQAIILAHYYQLPEIQDVADYVGDSLALSRYASGLDCPVVVVCGVDFMAESAKLLSPQKRVLNPAPGARCPMAQMIDPDALQHLIGKHPGAAVVSYVNSSYEIKAMSDVCCTSSNAVKIVGSLSNRDVIFVPDQHLASYVAACLPEKNIIPFSGYCPPHHSVTGADVILAREQMPEALVLVHPECPSGVCEMADFVGSTEQIIQYATKSSAREFVIGTEGGVLYPLRNKNPEKTFVLLSDQLYCPNMKKTMLADLEKSLEDGYPEVNLDGETAEKAAAALNRMLEVSYI